MMPPDARESHYTLFMRGFSSEIPENRIRDYFHREGGKCTIEFYRIKTDDAHRAFVALRFESKDVARDVIERFDNEEVMGCRIQVQYYKDYRGSGGYRGRGDYYLNNRRGGYRDMRFRDNFYNNRRGYDPVQRIRARARETSVMRQPYRRPFGRPDEARRSRSGSKTPEDYRHVEVTDRRSLSPQPFKYENSRSRSDSRRTPSKEWSPDKRAEKAPSLERNERNSVGSQKRRASSGVSAEQHQETKEPMRQMSLESLSSDEDVPPAKEHRHGPPESKRQRFSSKTEELADIPLPIADIDPATIPPPNEELPTRTVSNVTSPSKGSSNLLDKFKKSLEATKRKSKRHSAHVETPMSPPVDKKKSPPPKDVDMRAAGAPAGFRSAFQPVDGPPASPDPPMKPPPKAKIPSTISVTKSNNVNAIANHSSPTAPAPQAQSEPTPVEADLTASRASAIADVMTTASTSLVVEKHASPAPKKKKHKKLPKPDKNELKLSQIAMDLSADTDRQKRINKLPADKLEKLKEKKKEVELAYKRDCETFATVVKLLINKDPSLEDKILPSLRESLKEIGQKFMQELNQFVDSLLD